MGIDGEHRKLVTSSTGTPFTVRVIDTETAGHRLPDDAVIEIGSIDIDLATGETANAMRTFCDPAGIAINPAARKVHKITDEELEGAPPFAEAAEPFARAHTFAAQRASFDRSRLRFPGTWLCTYKLALRAFPEARAHGLQSLVKILDLKPDLPEGEHPHRALFDAVCTAELLRAIHGKLGPRCNGLADFMARAKRVSDEPALLAKFRFGKHKGERVREVPSDYLSWCLGEKDMNEDVRFTAAHELRRRGVLRDEPAAPLFEPDPLAEETS